MVLDEAYQYEMESGSLRAIEWELELILADKLNDLAIWEDKYVILVFIGFTFYNFARDARYRYAMSEETHYRFYELFYRYKELVKHICDANAEIDEIQKHHIEMLENVIYVAFIVNIHDENHFSDALEMLDRNNSSSNPGILNGLHLHYYAKLQAVEGNMDESLKEFETVTTTLLAMFGVGKAFFTSYYYDAIIGKIKDYVDYLEISFRPS